MTDLNNDMRVQGSLAARAFDHLDESGASWNIAEVLEDMREASLHAQQIKKKADMANVELSDTSLLILERVEALHKCISVANDCGMLLKTLITEEKNDE